MAGLIEALGLDRPHLMGLSFGGILALEFYRWYPTVPKTLGLASTYAGWAGSLPPDEVERRLQHTLHQLESGTAEWIDQLADEVFTANAPRETVEEAVAIARQYHPQGMRVLARAFAHLDLRPVLPRIEVPTLLLWGELDRRSPVHIGEDLNAKIPDSKLVVMPGVGHQSNMERPDFFNRELRSFLQP